MIWGGKPTCIFKNTDGVLEGLLNNTNAYLSKPY